MKPIGVEHLLFFRIRNELQFVKARKVISLEFPRFVKLTQVKLSCRNTIGHGSYMTNGLQLNFLSSTRKRMSQDLQ